jgi:hypothetical protein
MNIFERGTRENSLFPSVKGDLTIQQLWNLPLESKSNFSLDYIAITVNDELEKLHERSFVSTRANPAKATLELKLEILKHIIAVRQAENQAKLDAQKLAGERERLQGLLEKKKDEVLGSLSIEELESRLQQLGGKQ